ncbi:MMPL family transporter [Streptomyces sp. GLT-R25]
MNRLTRRIGDASARRPWVTIAAWVAALVLVLPLAGLVGGSFVDDLVAPGSQSEKAMELLEERFPEASGGSAVAVFAVPEGERIDRHRTAVEAAVGRVAEVEHVATVTDPFAAGTVSPDGRIGYVQVAFDVPEMEVKPEQVDALNDAIEPVRGDGVVAEIGGDAVFINAETPTSGAEAAGLLTALVILVVAFGTIVVALVPIALALVAVAAGLGSIVLLAHATDVSTAAPTIGAMIGLGVGIDYALFIVARCRENRAGGQDNATALSNAMSSSGAAVLFAGGTVIVAMSALALTGLGFLTSIGLSTSLVVLFAVATALTLLPALLSLLGDRIHKGRRHRGLRTRRAKKSRTSKKSENLPRAPRARSRRHGGGSRTASPVGRGRTCWPDPRCYWPWRYRRCVWRRVSPMPATTRPAPPTAAPTTCWRRASVPASTPHCSSSPT